MEYFYQFREIALLIYLAVFLRVLIDFISTEYSWILFQIPDAATASKDVKAFILAQLLLVQMPKAIIWPFICFEHPVDFLKCMISGVSWLETINIKNFKAGKPLL